MRMWMVSPKLLCNKHLLGEHGEIHKHRHNFVKKHSVSGRLYPIVQIEPESMEARHDQLAEEMLRRGMNHKSAYEQPDISHLGILGLAHVDTEKSIDDLCDRCDNCRELITTLEAA